MTLSFLHQWHALTRATTAPTPHPLRGRAVTMVAAIQLALPELLSVAVVEIRTGIALASHATVAGLVPAKAAPFHAELIRQKRQALHSFSLPEERIEDILITLREQVHLLRVSPDGELLVVVALSSRDATLALVRHVLLAHVN